MTENMKILLVDDADFFLETEKAFLKHTPATILTATNGAEALDVAVEHRPDLIYMDVQMPVMDGLSCLEILKSNPALKPIPVIMVFTPTGDITEERVEATRCDGVITKPIDRQRFLELGHQFLFDIDRRDKRASCQTTVDFTINGENRQGVGIDISEGGLYVQFREDLPDVERIRLSFFLPTVSAEKIELQGRVRWVNQGFPRPHLGMPQGFGLQFENLSPHHRSIISEYIAKN
ncbi:MAG: response regulator [Desulfuromonadales bacterium]|nr:response regulator [Desulfuromonadales bacterium]NIR33620.1 response regulator [Desulfuromonadales bacterium]NIS41240.1 response regulator [Desulfuromonadales bacterium]